MKKQNGTSVNHDYTDLEEVEAVKELNGALRKIDQLPLITPDIHWFEQLALDNKVKLRRKLRKEVALFLLTATIILTLVIFILFQMPHVFALLQVIVTVCVGVYSSKMLDKKVEKS